MSEHDSYEYSDQHSDSFNYENTRYNSEQHPECYTYQDSWNYSEQYTYEDPHTDDYKNPNDYSEQVGIRKCIFSV
jgi:hypothetical protein